MEPNSEPLIWALQTKRAGDNAQALELARLVGGRIEIKALSFNWRHFLPNLLLGASDASLADHGLAPPWPDLVIAVGKRTAPISRWIKAQSGGKAKTVHLGRPRAPLAWFDVVVSTPQYGLPAACNLVEMTLPFAAPRSTKPEDIAYWSNKWSHLPRPWIAVLLGGAKFPLRMGRPETQRLAAQAQIHAEQHGGSLLVFASPRTPRGMAEKIASGGRGHTIAHPWTSDENAYPCALALADQFIVTSDSISMMAEAIKTGRQVKVFELPSSLFSFRWQADHGLPAWLSRQGLLQSPRDAQRFLKTCFALGLASTLGQAKTPAHVMALAEEDVIARIRGLLQRD